MHISSLCSIHNVLPNLHDPYRYRLCIQCTTYPWLSVNDRLSIHSNAHLQLHDQFAMHYQTSMTHIAIGSIFNAPHILDFQWLISFPWHIQMHILSFMFNPQCTTRHPWPAKPCSVSFMSNSAIIHGAASHADIRSSLIFLPLRRQVLSSSSKFSHTQVCIIACTGAILI